MKIFFRVFLFCLALTFGFVAMAQVLPNLDPISNADFFSDAMKQLSGLNFNGGYLLVAGVVVQVAIGFLKTPLCGSIFPALNGFGKLCVVYLLSLLSGIIVLKSQGLSWSAVLVHSQTIFAFGVVIN
jgi:hypothetical protein